MGIRSQPSCIPVTTPLPELSALGVIAVYSDRYALTIRAGGGKWIVTGGGLEQPEEIVMYTDLIAFLAHTFGRI